MALTWIENKSKLTNRDEIEQIEILVYLFFNFFVTIGRQGEDLSITLRNTQLIKSAISRVIP